MSLRTLGWIAAALAAAVAHGASAQERFVDFADRTPTARELVEALKPAGRARTRTRALKLGPLLAAAETAATPTAVAAKVSLNRINFEFDSSELTPQAMQLLERVGQALGSSELAGLTFIVEGHTDATGDAGYNQKLSARRAQAVKDHLVARHGIGAERLKALGRGEAELLDEANPAGWANRRVVFASFAGS